MLRKFLRKITGNTSNINPREQLLREMPMHAVCAEIGVWKGDFSSMILDITKPEKLHLIDPWQYQTGFGKRLYGGKAAMNQDDMDAIYRGVVERFQNRNEVVIHRAFSDDAWDSYPDNYFDWLYIDGNHYYAYVLRDLQNALRKVKPQGFIAGDDYFWTSEELNGDKPVKRAVDIFVQETTSVVFHKRIGGQFMLRKIA